MPVFDFKNASKESSFECTYTTFSSDNKTASPEHPIFVLDNSEHNWDAETIGMFANPYKKTAFEFQTDDGNILSNILKVDARFTSLIKWLGENRIKVKLSGKNVENGYAVYRIREIAFNNSQKLSSEDGFLQYMIERLLDSSIVAHDIPDDELDESGDNMKLTSITSISDFLNCAGITLPDNIRLWARRNLAVARSSEVTPEEKRHAQRALSIMLNIQWKSNYFESIDPVEARRILDEELFGMESVKQRIIETVIQINRTHTLPSYGILLVGPAGTGKSQIAYLVAKILKMPWTTLDMSSINDPEQLTSAYDMAQIGAAVFGNPTLLEICSTTSATLPPTINNPNGRTYSMEHKLVVTGDSSDENYYPSAVAGKTGYTSLAGQTLVTYAEQDGRRQVAVTLKSTQRTHYSDTKTILDFGFARFKNVSVAENETDYVTGEEPVTIGDETYSPSDLYLDEKAVVTLPNDAQFSDADKYLQTEIPASHPEGAVARIIYTYNDRQIGVAWVYSTKAASAPVSAEDGTDNETAGSENTTDAAKTGTSSTADKEKKPLKLTKATYIAAGAGVVVLLIAAAVIWFMIQRKQEEERMRVLREKRRKRLADMGCSEEEFERLVNERKNALRERTMPEPDDDDGSGDEVSDHSEDLPEEYPDDEYDSWEDEHEDDLDDPDEKEDVPGEDR